MAELLAGAEALALVLGIMDDLVVRLRDMGKKGLKRKAERLGGFLVGIKLELPNMRQLDQANLLGPLEDALRDTLAIVDSISNAKGVVGRINFFVKGRSLRTELDESIAHIEQQLSLYRVAQGNRIEAWTLAQENEEDEEDDLADLVQDLDKATKSKNPRVMDAATTFKARIVDLPLEDVGRRMDNRADPLHHEIAKLGETMSVVLDEEKANIRAEDLVLGEQIGYGGFGQVLAASLNGKAVAVKRVLMKQSEVTVRGQEELRKEAETWKRIEHNNIVKLLGTAVKDGQLCLVMEKCDLSLHVLLYDHAVEAPLSADDRTTILKGIARGMAHLHSLNILHRDLKPRNVLLSREPGLVKLADFGMATVKADNSTRAHTTSHGGSTAYMAPEVLVPPHIWTTRADVYAYAVICWEVLHHRQPWTGERDIVSRVLAGERPAVDDSILTFPWVVPLLQLCWSQERQCRPLSSEVLATTVRGTQKRRSTKIVRDLLGFVASPRQCRNEKMVGGVGGVEGVFGQWESEGGVLRWWSIGIGFMNAEVTTTPHVGDEDRQLEVSVDVKKRPFSCEVRGHRGHSYAPEVLLRVVHPGDRIWQAEIDGATGAVLRAGSNEGRGQADGDLTSVTVPIHKELTDAFNGVFVVELDRAEQRTGSEVALLEVVLRETPPGKVNTEHSRMLLVSFGEHSGPEPLDVKASKVLQRLVNLLHELRSEIGNRPLFMGDAGARSELLAMYSAEFKRFLKDGNIANGDVTGDDIFGFCQELGPEGLHAVGERLIDDPGLRRSMEVYDVNVPGRITDTEYVARKAAVHFEDRLFMLQGLLQANWTSQPAYALHKLAEIMAVAEGGWTRVGRAARASLASLRGARAIRAAEHADVRRAAKLIQAVRTHVANAPVWQRRTLACADAKHKAKECVRTRVCFSEDGTRMDLSVLLQKAADSIKHKVLDKDLCGVLNTWKQMPNKAKKWENI